MVESKSDLWEHVGHAGHRVAISTNGFVKRNGEAVMGRGCAKQATLMFEGVARDLGARIRKEGNIPCYLFVNGAIAGEFVCDRLMILPVKHNWWEKVDLELVAKSVSFLLLEATRWPDWIFHVPRLGCGNGKLSWNVVGTLMAPLPDNVVVHS